MSVFDGYDKYTVEDYVMFKITKRFELATQMVIQNVFSSSNYQVSLEKIQKKFNSWNPKVHFKIPYITSYLGPFLSLYITFESNISNIRALWSPYITSKIYTGSKLDPACAK